MSKRSVWLVSMALLSSLAVLPAGAHGGEAKKLPDGQCLFKDGHIGECEENTEPAISEVTDQNPAIEANTTDSQSVSVETTEIESPMVISSNPNASEEGSSANLELKGLELPQSDGATATVDLDSENSGGTTAYAFLSFFVLMLSLGFILVKSRLMKNDIINKTKE